MRLCDGCRQLPCISGMLTVPPSLTLSPPQYVEEVLRSRQPLLIFLEEPPIALRLSAPAQQWLAMVYRAVRDGAVPDVLLVPVGIAYDVIPGGSQQEGAVRGFAHPNRRVRPRGAALASVIPLTLWSPLLPARRATPRPRRLPLGNVWGPAPEPWLRPGGLRPALLLAGTAAGLAAGDPGRPRRVYCRNAWCANPCRVDGGIRGGSGVVQGIQ